MPNDADGVLSSYTHGSIFKNIDIGEPWIRIILYFDEFEVVNPIGAHRKKHKIAAVYYAIDNFGSMGKNSELNGIFVAILSRAKDLQHSRSHYFRI